MTTVTFTSLILPVLSCLFFFLIGLGFGLSIGQSTRYRYESLYLRAKRENRAQAKGIARLHRRYKRSRSEIPGTAEFALVQAKRELYPSPSKAAFRRAQHKEALASVARAVGKG